MDKQIVPQSSLDVYCIISLIFQNHISICPHYHYHICIYIYIESVLENFVSEIIGVHIFLFEK